MFVTCLSHVCHNEESMWKLTNSKSLYILHLVDLSTGSLFNVYTPANISIIALLVNMPAECNVGRDPDFILLHTTLLLLPVLTFKLKMEQMWETCSGDTHAASGIQCGVELQTKVPEDYAKFYSHRLVSIVSHICLSSITLASQFRGNITPV